jgi:glutamate/tyrosine decarboxylase-like PLP-dependent enzyme
MPDDLTAGEEKDVASPFELPAEDFRRLGHRLVDRLADYFETIGDIPTAAAYDVAEVRRAVGERGLPEDPEDPATILDQAFEVIRAYGRHSGHPRSWGYIMGSAAPVGVLAELIMAGLNNNVASGVSYPAASEIEAQTVRWIAEMIGYPTDCGGLFTSGGNVANLIGFLVARRDKAGAALRRDGLQGCGAGRLCAYATEEAHSWLDKAADIAGLGTEAIRRVAADGRQRMDLADLERRIAEDRAAGFAPFLLVGSAGTTSTGAVDPLPEMAALARREGLWFHVDGAYGAPAVSARGAPPELAGLRDADSLAIDGHKWLFAPLEAGIALVRSRDKHRDTFDFSPSYYDFARVGDAGRAPFYYNYGPQNSRCFRALKMWTILRSVGRRHCIEAIEDNLRLARRLYQAVEETHGLQALTQSLSVTTFRILPEERAAGRPEDESYLEALNRRTLTLIQEGGEAYLSNAVIDGRYALRACITNFRSREADVLALPGIACAAAVRAAAELEREAGT